MAAEDQALGLPFEEAIEHFQSKLNLPTRRWNELEGPMHARAFTVAGAMKEDLLTGLRAAVDKAVSEGESYGQFRHRFDAVTKGWEYNGSPGWRSRLIYETNLRTAYQAGRYRRMTDPEVLRDRPFWEYVHGASADPRPKHLDWHGMVLPADDPWWETHYPPNGWGCSCRVRSMSRRDLERKGKSGPDEAPPVETRTWTDKATGESQEVPAGIDPGWAYNVGEAGWGREWATRRSRRGPFTEVAPFTVKQYPWLPALPAAEPLPVPLGPRLHGAQDLGDAIPKGAYPDALGETVQVGEALAKHIVDVPRRWDGREQFLPLIPLILERPAEVWAAFLRHDDGLYSLRRRYFAKFDTDAGARTVGVLVDVISGEATVFDVFFGKNPAGGRLRSGRLIYSRQAK